jgi:hypothetical protein
MAQPIIVHLVSASGRDTVALQVETPAQDIGFGQKWCALCICRRSPPSDGSTRCLQKKWSVRLRSCLGPSPATCRNANSPGRTSTTRRRLAVTFHARSRLPPDISAAAARVLALQAVSTRSIRLDTPFWSSQVGGPNARHSGAIAKPDRVVRRPHTYAGRQAHRRGAELPASHASIARRTGANPSMVPSSRSPGTTAPTPAGVPV